MDTIQVIRPAPEVCIYSKCFIRENLVQDVLVVTAEAHILGLGPAGAASFRADVLNNFLAMEPISIVILWKHLRLVMSILSG